MTGKDAADLARDARQRLWSMAIALLALIVLATLWGMTASWSFALLPNPGATEPDRWHTAPFQLGIIAVSVAIGSVAGSLLVRGSLPRWPWRRPSGERSTSELPWSLAIVCTGFFEFVMADSSLWVDYSMRPTYALIPQHTLFPMAFDAIVYTDIGSAIPLVVGSLGWVIGFALGLMINALRTDQRRPAPTRVPSRA